MRLAYLFLLGALVGCADDPAPGTGSPCDTPGGPLLGCPPPAVQAPPTVEEACWRFVECGLLLVDQTNDNGDHFGDYQRCVDLLGDDSYSADRLRFVLTCVGVSTCQDLAAGHCEAFGGEAPQP